MDPRSGTPKIRPSNTNATPTHPRKRMEDEWEEKCTLWYIQKGFLCGVTMNMRDAIDEQYYSQLKNINTAYRNTTPIQILVHFDTCWCPLNMQAHKNLKKEFYTNWDSSDIHFTAFGMKLDKEQNRLDRLGIVISNADKLQFYLKQIYACFNKTELVTWENKPIIVKDNYTQAKLYFVNSSRILKHSPKTAGVKQGRWGMKAPTTWQTWATRSGNTSKKLPVPLSQTRKELQRAWPTSAKRQGQRMPR
jgi:hypothetical protein